MRIVVFGLTISSSWGNGHATLWRGLCRALSARGHAVTFYERDVAYYASSRDDASAFGCDLRLYRSWPEIPAEAGRLLDEGDVGVVTSFCPDAERATELLIRSKVPVKAYYDLDTPVTLEAVARGHWPPYLPARGFVDFDVVFSFAGGRVQHDLQSLLGARTVVPLFGSADPSVHFPTAADDTKRAALSYIGTYARERQTRVESLFLEPARRRPSDRFTLAGSQYPADFPWPGNVYYVWHLPPGDHPRFYASSRWTLNVTRDPMVTFGYCPPGRLFEAAACGTPILTDAWEGLESFFEPGQEVVVVHDTDDVLRALDMEDAERLRIGRRARERALDCHTADRRAIEFERAIVAGAPRARNATGLTVSRG